MTKIKSPLKHNEKEGDKHPVGQYVLKPEIWEERHNAFHAKQTSEEKPEETEEIEQTEEPEKSDSETYPWGGSKDRQGQFLAPFKPIETEEQANLRKVKEKLKETTRKNEEFDRFVISGLYNDEELNIIKDEILNTTYSVGQLSEEEVKETQTRELFKRLMTYSPNVLDGSNIESIDILSEMLGYDDYLIEKLSKKEGVTQEELDRLYKNIATLISDERIKYTERDGIIKIEKGSNTADYFRNQGGLIDLDLEYEGVPLIIDADGNNTFVIAGGRGWTKKEVNNFEHDGEKGMKAFNKKYPDALKTATPIQNVFYRNREKIREAKELREEGLPEFQTQEDIYIDKATGEIIDKNSISGETLMKLDPETEFFEAFNKGQKNLVGFYGENGETRWFSKKYKQIVDNVEYEGLFQEWVKTEYGEDKLNSLPLELSAEELELRSKFNDHYGFSNSKEMKEEYDRLVYLDHAGNYRSGLMLGIGDKSSPYTAATMLQQLYSNAEVTYQDLSWGSGGTDYVMVYDPLNNKGLYHESNTGIAKTKTAGDIIYHKDLYGPFNMHTLQTFISDKTYINWNNSYSNNAQSYKGNLNILNKAFKMEDMAYVRNKIGVYNLPNMGDDYVTSGETWKLLEPRLEKVSENFNDFFDGTGYTLKADVVGGDLTFVLSKDGEEVLVSAANGTNSPDTDVLQFIANNITPQQMDVLEKEGASMYHQIEKQKQQKAEGLQETMTDKEVFREFSKQLSFPEVTRHTQTKVTQVHLQLEPKIETETLINYEKEVINYINKSIIENTEIDKEIISNLVNEHPLNNDKSAEELNSIIDQYFIFGQEYQKDFIESYQQVKDDYIRNTTQDWGEKKHKELGIENEIAHTDETYIIKIDGEEVPVDHNTFLLYNDRMMQNEQKIASDGIKENLIAPIESLHERGIAAVFETSNGEVITSSDDDFVNKYDFNNPPKFIRYDFSEGADQESIYDVMEKDLDGFDVTLHDQMFGIQEKMSTIFSELENSKINYYNNIIDSYDITQALDVANSEKGKERSYRKNFATRFTFGVDNVVFGIPALLGHEGSQERLRRNTETRGHMIEYEWGEAPWYQNVGMVFADQGANMLFFIGTMGTGTALNLSRNLSMFIASGGVGLQSGGDKHVQLLTNKLNAEQARKELLELEKLKKAGLIDEKSYNRTKNELRKIEAYADFSPTDHFLAVTSTIGAEGGLTYLFGRVGRLNTSNRVVNMFTGGNRSTFHQLKNYSGTKQMWDHSVSGLRSAGFEVLEEESIYVSTALTDAAFLGRDVDFSQIKKVAIDAAIMSGGTNAMSLTHDGFMNHGIRSELRDKLLKLDNLIENKLKEINNLDNLDISQKEKDTRRQNLMNEYIDLEKTRVGTWAEAHIDILGLDEKSQKAIISNYQEILSLHREAGIEVEDNLTKQQIETKLEYHKQKLNQERPGKGDEWLANYTKKKNYINDEVLTNYNEETAKQSIYGPDYKEKRNSTINRLKRSKERAEAYDNASPKQKLFMEMQFMYEENLNKNANAIKNDNTTNEEGKTYSDLVEEKVFSPDPSYEINGVQYESVEEFNKELNRLKNEGKLTGEGKYNIVVNNDEAAGNQVEILLKEAGVTTESNTTLDKQETKLNQEQWKEQNNKKRITSEQKQKLDAWYRHVARKRISANTGRDFTKFEEGEINADRINEQVKNITGKDLTIVNLQGKNENEIRSYLDGLNLSAKEYDNVLLAITNGNGAIVNNKFLTVNNEAKNLLNSTNVGERNKAFVGAVWLHETGHYLDNSTKSRAELNEKALLLSKGLLEGKYSSAINDIAIQHLEDKGYLIDGEVMKNVEGVYNMLQDADVNKVVSVDKDGNTITKKDQINTWLDEYIREAEFTLQDGSNDFIYKKLLSEGRRFGKIRSWVGDYTVKSSRDAIFEVVSYIESFRKGELSAVYKSQLERAKGRTDLVGDELQIQRSVQTQINDLVRNQEGEIVTKDQYDMDQVGDAAMLLTPGDETLNGSIVGLGFRIEGNEVYGFPKDEFIQAVKDQLSTAVMNYNPETEYKGVMTGDLSGWLARHILLKKPGVLEDFKKRREALDAAKEPGIEESVIETPEGTVVFAKRLGFDEKVIGKDDNGKEITRNEFDLIVEDIFNEIVEANPKSYKDVKDLVKGGVLVKILNKVAAEFGVNPNKLINDTALTVSERRSIQTKIRSLTARTLLNALPEGFNNVAEATGLPNVLLNAKNPETGEPNLLYNKQEQRAKTGVKQRVGRRFIFPPKKKDKGGAGPFLQVMNFVNDINESHFLDLFGITPVGVESKFRTEDRSVDSPLRAIVVQVAALIANQSTRKIANERGLFGLETIASGKADVQYSKKIAQSGVEQLINDYSNNRATFLGVLNQLGVSKVDENTKLFKEVFYQGLEIAYPNTQWTYNSVNYKNELYKEYNKYRELFVEKFKNYEKPIELNSDFNLIDYLTLEATQDPEFVLAKVFDLGPLKSWIENEINRENQRSYNRNLIAPYIKKLNERGVFDNEIIKAAEELGITPAELQALIRFAGLKAAFEGGYSGLRGSQSIFKNKDFYFDNFLIHIVPGLESITRDRVTLKNPNPPLRITVNGKTVSVKRPDYYKYATSGKQKTEKQHIIQRDKNNNPILSKELITEMEQREELSEEALLFVDDLYAIGAKLSKDPTTKWNKYNFAILIDQMNKDMGTPLRIGAAPMWLALDAPTTEVKDENGKKTFEWEHGGPARKVNLMFIDKHWNSADISLDDIKKTFQVGVLHRDFNDNVSRFFKERMNFGFQIGDSPLGRWNDSMLLGGPAHLLINWKTGEIVGQTHVDYYNKTLNHRKGTQQSRAVQNSRLIDHNTERRGMSAWDFDDTLATTKSGVRATIPNPEGTPQPGRKVIFLAGGAGSGKSNVVSKLNLENKGFKIVNQDISLEWLKKNNGLPENMNDLTKEQRSTLGKLGHQARKIARGKMMKYQGNAEGIVVDGTGGSLNAMQKLVDEFKEKGYDVSMLFVETSLETALERNKARAERSLLDKIVIRNHEAVQGNKKAFKDIFGNRFMQVKTDNLTQDSPMPNKLVEKIDDFVNSYKKIRLDAEEFATQGAEILEQGGVFDFSEFNVVTEGTQGPMFKAAFDRAQKYGTEDTYVLTARPPESAQPIQEFLASQGLNIPLENITGLGNSTGEAKAEWILEKFSEGYNDIYFADDAMQNVKAVKDVLDQLDIKSEVIQAKIQQSRKINFEMDRIIPVTKAGDNTGINNVKDVGTLTADGVYSNIQFSKKHRGEYENLISKSRPDLVEAGLVSQSVDQMFDLVNNLSVPPAKRRKYEKIMTKWLATSVMKLPEDNYKLQDAVELAEKNKEDIFAYSNPNQIIEKYAGKPKGPIDPDTIELFVKDESKTNDKYGITEYVVTEDRENNEFWIDDGQQAVRKIVDTHWGPKSNPWCIIARDKDGTGGMQDAMENWERYSDGPKRIVFQNGKLLAFYASNQYWDRMDNNTDEPVVNIKKGRVTEKAELVPIGDGKYQEFVLETRTVSEDGNTVETLYNQRKEYDQIYEYAAGTRKVENKVNGQTVKETQYRPDGTIQRETSFKNGKAIETRTISKGRTSSINNGLGDMSAKDVVPNFGDLIAHEITEGNTDYWFGKIHLESQGIESEGWRYRGPSGKDQVVTEVGFSTKVGEFELMDVMKRVDGKLRLDLPKIAKIDPDIKGLPPGIQFSKIGKELGNILEATTGMKAEKVFSETQAKIEGNKFKFRGIIPSSAQDFAGLLYNFLGKGKVGEKQMEFFRKTLIDPFSRGINELNAAKQSATTDYNRLKENLPDVKNKLKKDLSKFGIKGSVGKFSVDQAIRVYLWDKAGFTIPGLSKRDQKGLVDFVKSDVNIQSFADQLGLISKRERGYAEPSNDWLIENIASDLMSDGSIGEVRADFLAEWIKNKNEIFSEENLNKIEAIYGSKFREALKDMLWRMETGRSRKSGGGRLMNEYMNWLNGSVGAIMFFNMRSALLQTISSVNYLNWSDNNPLKAAAAFANQKQYWKDFVFLFNSDYLKQRRAGNRRGVNEAELSAAVRGKGPAEQAKAAIRYLLKIGFLPTQIADSFAIASGGASFYRNRVNSYLKQGMSRAEAEERAFLDFQETTEVSQQSARPDMLSQQQTSPLGRLILSFQNTPMQYGRVINKAARDIANGRGDLKTHISKIIYYGFLANILFQSLQTAIWAVLGDEEEEKFDERKTRILNGMLDTLLTTIGYGGKAISTLKNTLLEYHKQREKTLDDNYFTRAEHANTILQLLSFSPPIQSKIRKIYQSMRTEEFNRDLIRERGLTLDNPVWNAIGNTVEGFTNLPLGRLSNKMLNIDNALDSQNTWTQRLALLFGWSTWNLGIKDPDLVALGEDIKERKKQEKQMEKERKKAEKEREKLREKYPDKTDEQIDEAVVIEEKAKQIFDLNKREQVQIIEDLKLNPKDYPKEKDRVDIIIEHYNKDPEKMDSTLTAIENYVPSESEQRSIDLFKMNKKDQVNMLIDLGLSSKQIKKLKYEEDRVNKIIELENKKKSK